MLAPRTGHPETTIAEEQEQYLPITVCHLVLSDGNTAILTRFQPSEEERKRIAAGEDLYIGQLNFGGPMTPMMVDVGVPSYVPPPPVTE